MKKLMIILSSVAIMLLGHGTAFAQDDPGYECDNQFGACGTPNQSGGGCGCGGGSILVNNTDVGDTYQFADDYDDDGIEDNFDNCPRLANLVQADSDGDMVGDACDNCLSIPNGLQFNIDGDQFGDECDDDMDGDNIPNVEDNCESTPNPLLNGLTVQPDLDLNGIGDACDDDIDGDGIANLEDGCPMDSQITTPTDEQRTLCFPDLDGDNIPDILDNCPSAYNPVQENLNGSSLGDMCDPDVDGDGIHNPYDNCPDVANADQIDGDRDRAGDACDGNFCFVVYGDDANCLDPKGDLGIYTPNLIGETGQPNLLRFFANRESQPMRYTFRVVDQPEGADMRIDNSAGIVKVSSPYEYRYLQDEAVFFHGSKAGQYVIEVTAETIWEDRVSGHVNDAATFQAVVTLSGDDQDIPAAESGDSGCQVASKSEIPMGSAWMLLLGFVGLAIRRRKS